MGKTCGCADIRTPAEKQVQDFIKTLKSKPETKKFNYSKTNVATFTKSYASKNFGGSVFQPIGQLKEKRTKKNPLENEIKNAQVNVLYGGGYYILRDVR